MNKFGDVYIAELTDKKIDKTTLRWMLLNRGNIPILKDLKFQVPNSFPFNAFLIDMGNFEQQVSCLYQENKYVDNEKPQSITSDLKLGYSGRGKPYFSDINLKFSVSHTAKSHMTSGDINTDKLKKTIWGCAISNHEIGFDIQFVRPVKYREISEKYFSRLEQDFVREYGIDGFFQLWTRREAFGKAVAEGFFINDKDFKGSVGRDFKLLEDVKYQSKSLKLFTYKLDDGLWASFCIIMNGVFYG